MLEIEMETEENIEFAVPFTRGGSGTSDYEPLKNKPSINGVVLIGNKTTKELGIETSKEVHIGSEEPTGEETIWIDPTEEPDKIPTKTSELENDSGYATEEFVNTAIQNALEVVENGTY